MKDCLRGGFVRLGGFALCIAVTLGVALLLFGIFSIVGGAEESRCVEADKKTEERVRLGLYLFSDSISFEDGTEKNELCDAFSHIIKDDPYLLFVSESMSYTYDTDGNIIAMHPEYSMTRIEALSAILYCETRLSDICELAEDIDGDYEKAAFLHDYICKNFKYDKELENDDIYSFLRDGKGTCRAYTMLYTALLRKCGIDATYALTGGEKAGHMWNTVIIDGVRYQVDVTWDDALSGENISREYFMLSDT